MSKMRTALQIAAKQFRMYEEQHRAKGTEEADAKARVNFAMAEMCENALRESEMTVTQRLIVREEALGKELPIVTEVKREPNDMATAIWSDGERTSMSLRNYPGEDEDTIRGRLESLRTFGG